MTVGFKTIKRSYDVCADYVNQRELKERFVMGFLLLAVVYVLWFLLMQTPLKRSKAKLINQQETLSKMIEIKQTQLTELVQKTGGGSVQVQFKTLQMQEQKLNRQIQLYTQRLITIEKMTAVLRSVFAETQGLTLISFKNVPDKLLVTLPASQEQKNETALYEQGVELTFEGDFFNTLNYLQALEKTSWPIFWDQLTYTVTEYPKAKIVLRVHTLSEQKED